MSVTTYLLTPQSTVLLKKLTGSQLVQKFPAFYGTRRSITTFTSASHPSLSWARSIQSMPPHPTSWRPILILSSQLRLNLPSGLVPLDFSTKTLYTPLLSPLRASCPSRDYCVIKLNSCILKHLLAFSKSCIPPSIFHDGTSNTSPSLPSKYFPSSLTKHPTTWSHTVSYTDSAVRQSHKHINPTNPGSPPPPPTKKKRKLHSSVMLLCLSIIKSHSKRLRKFTAFNAHVGARWSGSCSVKAYGE